MFASSERRNLESSVNGHKSSLSKLGTYQSSDPVRTNPGLQSVEIEHEGPARRNILLVDRCRLTRECLLELLQNCCPDLEFIAAESTRVSFEEINEFPDLVLLRADDTDITTLNPNDFEPFHSNAVPLMAIVDAVTPAQAVEALQKGFAGAFFAGDNVDLLLAAIRLVLAGGRFLPPVRSDLGLAAQNQFNSAS